MRQSATVDKVSGAPDERPGYDWLFRPEAGAGQLPDPGRERSSHAAPRRRRKRRTLPYVLALVVFAVAAGATIFVVLSGGHRKPATGFRPTGSSASQDAGQTARAFLTAWAAGDLRAAGNITNRPGLARSALAAFGSDLHLRHLTAVAATVTSLPSASARPRARVTCTVSATVAASDGATASGSWHYRTSLIAYRGRQAGYWYVAWTPSDLAPGLTASTHLATVSVAPHVAAATDAAGTDLSSYGDAGLNNVAAAIEAGPPAGHGRPGLDVEVQNASGKRQAGTAAAVVIRPGTIQGLPTTIDRAAELAAQSAVGMHASSSMVAIQPSTGKILAIANNDGGNDFALTAAVAPGSTMKTITSTALFTEGVLNPDSQVACPKVFTIQGVRYHNDKGESEPGSTPFITDFAQSCNNAFSTQWSHLTGGRLAAAARDYYGLDQKWNIGLGSESASYFHAPPSASGSELAQEAFGEGALTASPIAMASIAATIADGRFHQPYLATGEPRVTARPLPATTDRWLKEMMRAVVTSGTAEPVGFGPGVYAKTGTADVNGQGQPNSWLIAFAPAKDVAVACLVLNAGYGAEVAGPEVRAFLGQY